MKAEIIGKLRNIEDENDVTILYACESGSRAWGFDNVDSDYDVRFIYKSNDIHEYITLSDTSDVIECMDGKLDVVGWDIKKALKLHYSGNPNLREWLISPVKYIDWDYNIFDGLEEFDMAKLKYHYTSIAVNNWKMLSRDDLEFTKRAYKMFLYNCRCILTCRVINQGVNSVKEIKMTPDENYEIIGITVNGQDYIFEAESDGTYTMPQFTNVTENIMEWMSHNLEMMRRDFPKTDDSRDFEKYNQRFFDIVLPNYEDYKE